MSNKRILVYGYGNPGRQDDGLGPALVKKIESEGFSGVDTDCNYQLNIEDALAVSGYDAVIFVDAASGRDSPFTFSRIEPSMKISFTTHAMTPESVLALCEELFGARVEAYMLAISGAIWDFGEGFSESAEQNMEAAFGYVRERISELQAV